MCVKTACAHLCLTIHGCEDHSGVVVGDNICIAILWLVNLEVGVLPGELLPWIYRLTQRRRAGDEETSFITTVMVFKS